MSILSGDEILREVREGRILIDPFDESRVQVNSYDVSLADILLTYDCHLLDAARPNRTAELPIPAAGLVLCPGVLYLGSTVEAVGSEAYVPWIDGRSSFGRLGMSVHVTAGRGDLGFFGRLTCEITVVLPLRVYPGMRCAQVTFFDVKGTRSRLYKGRKYDGAPGAVASRSWMDFARQEEGPNR